MICTPCHLISSSSSSESLVCEEGSEDGIFVKWKGFKGNIFENLESFKRREDFSDVSLSCDSNSQSFVKGHKLILASCSPYFRKILKDHPCPHPLLILNDVSEDILHALMTYMYHGSVSVSEKQLESFINTAKNLNIQGIVEDDIRPFRSLNNNLSLLATAAIASSPSEHSSNRRKSAPKRRIQDDGRILKLDDSLNETDKNEPLHSIDGNPLQDPQSPPSYSSSSFYSSSCIIKNEYTTPVEFITDSDVYNHLPQERERQRLNFSNGGKEESLASLLGPLWKSRQPRLCPYCKRMFSNKFNLKQHILNMHTLGREITCEQCTKKVKNKWYLRRHHVTHHGAPLKK